MSSASLKAGEVMDAAASLMNDTAKSTYTYAAQMPYLNMALSELQEQFQQNNVPVTNETTSSPIVVPIGTTVIRPRDGQGSGVSPYYPDDLVEIRGMQERLSGTTDPYIPLVKRDFLPAPLVNLPTEALQYYVFEGQIIKFIGALTARDVRIDYVRTLFPTIVDESQSIGIINAKTYLMYQTAGLCSEYIGENKTRADSLYAKAVFAIDRAIGISSKARQAINTRRKPFMAAYKRRSFS